jgi:ABC-type branched-subunit amino acid transport system substrate-binding protein
VADAMIGDHLLSLYTYLFDTPESKGFSQAWFKKFNYYPDDVHATPYVATQTVLKALEASKGDTSPDKLR